MGPRGGGLPGRALTDEWRALLRLRKEAVSAEPEPAAESLGAGCTEGGAPADEWHALPRHCAEAVGAERRVAAASQEAVQLWALGLERRGWQCWQGACG